MRIGIGLLLLFLFSACKDGKRYHEEYAQKASTPFAQETLEYRKSLNDFFRDPETSPLPDRYRADFDGLDFFPPDSTYRVKAYLRRTPESEPFLMPTTTDRQALEKVYGVVTFTLQGAEYSLPVYESADVHAERESLFLPFTDATNGDTTYAGGRYIDLEYPRGDTLVIDFNRSYNPYCVYNKKFSCPLVPRENDLPIEVMAGIKMFQP